MADTFVTNYNGARATNRGTPIVKSGEDMNKDAFLTILAAELQNLDPTADVDSTQYITQMAQFATMEQMSNLNNTITDSSTYSLVGKGVTLNSYDSNGLPYTGVVAGVTKTAGSYTLSVEINVDGVNTYKDFDISNVLTVLEVPDYSLPPLNNMNGNMSMLLASAYIGKYVELSEKVQVDGEDSDKNITGKVVGVTKKNGEIYVRVEVDGSDEIIEYTYDKVINVSGTSFSDKEDSETEEA